MPLKARELMKKVLPTHRILFLVPLFGVLLVAMCLPDEFSRQSSLVQAQGRSAVPDQSPVVDLQVLQRLTDRALAICGQMEQANYWERRMLRKQFAEVNEARQNLLMSLM